MIFQRFNSPSMAVGSQFSLSRPGMLNHSGQGPPISKIEEAEPNLQNVHSGSSHYPEMPSHPGYYFTIGPSMSPVPSRWIVPIGSSVFRFQSMVKDLSVCGLCTDPHRNSSAQYTLTLFFNLITPQLPQGFLHLLYLFILNLLILWICFDLDASDLRNDFLLLR